MGFIAVLVYDNLVISGPQFAKFSVMQWFKNVICAFVRLYSLRADIAEVFIIPCFVNLLEGPVIYFINTPSL